MVNRERLIVNCEGHDFQPRAAGGVLIQSIFVQPFLSILSKKSGDSEMSNYSYLPSTTTYLPTSQLPSLLPVALKLPVNVKLPATFKLPAMMKLPVNVKLPVATKLPSLP